MATRDRINAWSYAEHGRVEGIPVYRVHVNTRHPLFWLAMLRGLIAALLGRMRRRA